MSEIDNPQPSMVAETAVAAYGKTSASYPAFFGKASRTIAGVEAPPAVWEFAREHELVPYIEMVIQWARAFFPTACNFALEYVIDPEIEGYSWIDLQFYVSGTVEEAFEQYQRLNKERARRLPPDKSEKIGINIGGDEIWSEQNSLTFLRRINNCGVPELQEISEGLQNLYRRRRQADYNLCSPIFKAQPAVALDVASAAQMIATIQICKKSQNLRVQIRDGIREYERKIDASSR